MLLYETHCHTRVSSLCGRIAPAELVDLYLANGYAGVFVTDHFINGNCPVRRDHPGASHAEQVHAYCESYRQVRDAAAGRLDVFLGVEFPYGGTDILIYGWDEDALAALPRLVEMDMRSLVRFANDAGMLTVQAHPFREADYIDHIRLYPDVLAVETYNACRSDRCNRLARAWADICGKPATGGTDLHAATLPLLGATAFPERVESPAHFRELVLSGVGRPVSVANRLAPAEP